MIVGHGPTALAVGAVGDCLDIFLSSIVSLLSPPLLKVARYRLKYCLKGQLNQKQPKYNMVQENKENLVLRWPTLFFSENSVLENFLILKQCIIQLHSFRKK